MPMVSESRIRYVFDLHCDTLAEIERYQLNLSNVRTDLSLHRIPEDYRICQCMAIFIPDKYRGAAAKAYFDRVYQYYLCQLERYRETVIPLNDPACAEALLQQAKFVPMLTVEGGAVLAGKLENLYGLYKCGVKMITLTWNGANELCGGAATDEGFTVFGRQAVSLMEELGIVVDVSHLSDRGFWELCDFARRPFVASHSNARGICGHRRNLTDDMFRQICSRGGLVGLNYYKAFIADDGRTTEVGDLIRHAHHFLELGGAGVLALGSDFDGAEMPGYMKGIDAIPQLYQAFVQSGIPEGTVNDIFFGNARRFFADYCNIPVDQQ